MSTTPKAAGINAVGLAFPAYIPYAYPIIPTSKSRRPIQIAVFGILIRVLGRLYSCQQLRREFFVDLYETLVLLSSQNEISRVGVSSAESIDRETVVGT